MDVGRPSFVNLIWLIYRDAGKALWTLRHLAWTACLIGCAHSLARLILYSPGFAGVIGANGRDLIALMFCAGWIFLLVPFLIAVHRFILFDEAASYYAIEPRNPRVLRFFGSWLVLAVVAAVPVMLATNALATVRIHASWWLLLAIAPFVILPIILGLRMTLILPAIAADAPGATWANAYQDTKGHTWGIFLIYLAVEVPFLIASVVVMVVTRILVSVGLLLMARAEVPIKIISVLSTLASLAIFNILGVCSAVLFVVVASRLLQLLGDRVRHLPGPQTA